MVAEATSLVTNLGTEGIGYINGDLTVALSRLPVDDWICIQGDSHWACDGIAVGTATLFDHQGAFGSGMTTAVANPAAQIDFTTRPFGSGASTTSDYGPAWLERRDHDLLRVARPP